MLWNILCELGPILVFLCRNKHGTIYVETPFRRDMALNLTRTVATQAVRTFTHQTWVSGDLWSLCHSFCINIRNPSLALLHKNPVYTYYLDMLLNIRNPSLTLLQAPLARESHSQRSVHMDSSSLPECSQVGSVAF